MDSQELTRALHDGEPSVTATPDLPLLRARGRRRRSARRGGITVSVAAVLVLVAGGVSFATGNSLLTGQGPQIAGPRGGSLSSYQRAVLEQVDGSYAVDGTVIVPWPVAPHSSKPQIVGAQIPTGLHWFGELGFSPPSSQQQPDLLREPPPRAHVVVDYGKVALGCVQGPDPACLVEVYAGADPERPVSVNELGSATDLSPVGRVRLLIEPSWADQGRSTDVIGGFGGLAARVSLTLGDGSRLDAGVDSGTVSKGDTLFWANTNQPVRRITAYAPDGTVVRDQQVRKCDETNSCGDPLS